MSDDQPIEDRLDLDGIIEAPRPDTRQAASGEDVSMDQLRGILLGPLSSDLELKLSQLSQRVEGTLIELDRRTAERVDRLETRMTETRQELDSGLGELRDKLRGLTENAASAGEEQRAEWTRELQQLRISLEELTATLNHRLGQQREALRTELVDRESLSAALSELSFRLTAPGGSLTVDPTQSEIDLDGMLEESVGGASVD